MVEQAELIKYSAKTKSNFLMQPCVIKMLIKGKEINLFLKKVKKKLSESGKIKKGPLVKL